MAEPLSAEEFLSQSDNLILDQDLSKNLSQEFINSQADKYRFSRLGPKTPTDADNMTGEMGFVKRYQTPGIPIMADEGLSPWTRLALGFRKSDEDKARYLVNKYGEGNVRATEEGTFLIKVKNADGTEKEILSNEFGPSVGDVTQFTPTLLQSGAALLAMRGGRAIPVVGKLGGKTGFLRDAATGATGSEAAGAVQDVAVGTVDTGSVPPLGPIIKDRASNIPVDIALDVTMAGTAKGLRGAVNLTANPVGFARKSTQNEALRAKERIKQATQGQVDLQLSAGEASGLPFLSMLESYVEQKPSGTTAQLEFKNKQDAIVAGFQNYLFGGAKAEEEIGEAAVKTLQGIKTGLEGQTRESALSLQKSVTEGILDEMGRLTTPQSQNLRTEVGQAIRGRVQNLRDQAKAESNTLFGEVKTLIGDNDRIFAGAGLAQDAKDIIKAYPKIEKVVTEESALVDRLGRTVVTSEKKEVPLKEFIPEGIMSRVRALAEAGESNFSLQDLQQLRADVYDDIRKSEAVPGFGTGYLKRIGSALTKSIDEGVSNVKDPNVKAALTLANAHYKKEVLKFEEAGLGDLFVKTNEPGFKENAQIVERLINDPDKYKRTMNIIGPKSNEAKVIRRNVMDSVFNDALIDLDGNFVDAKKFMAGIKEMRSKKPEIFNDVFGKNANKLYDMSKVASLIEGEVPQKELMDIIQSNRTDKQIRDGIRKLVSDREKEKQLYRNTVIKKFTSGELGSASIKPSEFVNNFIDSASPNEIKDVMSKLSGDPDLTEQIRRKTIEKLFLRSERAPTAVDITRKGMGDKTVMASGSSVKRQLTGQEDKIRAIIGNDSYQLLNDYLLYEAARDFKKEVAEGVGMFSKGSAIGGLLNGVPGLKELNKFVKYKVISNILANKQFRDWTSNTWEAPQFKDLAKVIITSEPFVKAAVEDYGRGTAVYRFLRNFKPVTDAPDEEPSQGVPSAEDFLNAEPQ